jgi:hypothetical protein
VGALHFRVRLNFGDEKLLPRLKAVAEAVRCGAADSSWLENHVLLAARDLLAIEERTEREIARVPATRPATREGIFERVCRAREFLYASQDRRVCLDEASRAACLALPFASCVPAGIRRNTARLPHARASGTGAAAAVGIATHCLRDLPVVRV